MAGSGAQPTRLRRPSGWRRRFGFAVGATLAAVCLLPGSAAAAPSASAAREQLDILRQREQALAGQIATFSRLIDLLNADIATLQARRSALEATLRDRRDRLVRTQRELERVRTRLVVLKRQLAHARRVLAARLVDGYKNAEPDLVSVVINSKGFVDLLERAEFIQRINRQDRRVIVGVRRARDEVQVMADRLTVLERRQRRLTAIVLAQRNQVATIGAALDAKRAGVVSAQSDVRVALRAVSARRGRLETRLAALESAQARLGADLKTLGALAGWAIPWAIVRCESGGRNHPPNAAGASGYYQIIPSTWKAFGGRTAEAYQASKAEQDRIAARIWRNGAGARNWVCAAVRR